MNVGRLVHGRVPRLVSTGRDLGKTGEGGLTLRARVLLERANRGSTGGGCQTVRSRRVIGPAFERAGESALLGKACHESHLSQ